jgi:hypothetical protein
MTWASRLHLRQTGCLHSCGAARLCTLRGAACLCALRGACLCTLRAAHLCASRAARLARAPAAVLFASKLECLLVAFSLADVEPRAPA